MEKINIVKVAENATTRRPVKVRNFLEFSKEEVGETMYSIVCSEKKYVENMGEALPGMGPVSQIRVLQELDDFKSLLYKDLIAATKDAADRVGVEKVIEALEELK